MLRVVVRVEGTDVERRLLRSALIRLLELDDSADASSVRLGLARYVGLHLREGLAGAMVAESEQAAQEAAERARGAVLARWRELEVVAEVD